MPTYEYECQACGHSFERFQQMSDAPVKVCPVCGKRKVKRLLGTGAGIIFRGSGFYATDYRNNSSGRGNGGSNGKDSGKSESKDSADKAGGKKDE
ncbi:MAG: FmdB family zinc ribbon protein [Phycisphaerae bacterium]